MGPIMASKRELIEIRFVACYEEVDPTCAPKNELEEFLNTH